MERHRLSRPRRKPTPTMECQNLGLQTEQTLSEDNVSLSLSLPLKLKMCLCRRPNSVETSTVGTQTDLIETQRPRTPLTQRSPPMIRTRFPRTSAHLPAPIPLYPIALGPPSHRPKKPAKKTEESESATPIYVVPMESIVYSVSEKQSYTRDALDTEIVDILQNPTDKGHTEMMSTMYDRLVKDGRSCYMSSSESHCPFFIGEVPFGFECPESMRKLKQVSTKGKILSWIFRSPTSRKNLRWSFQKDESRRHLDILDETGESSEMASSTPGRDRMLSPVPSPIGDTDVLKYINQRHLQRESVFIECSDPGVREDQEMYGPSGPRAPPRNHLSLAVVPARSVHTKSATAAYRTPSMNVRSNSEFRWHGVPVPAVSAIAVPLVTNRRRQTSQSAFSKRGVPETIDESPATFPRLSSREQTISVDDMASEPAVAAAADAPIRKLAPSQPINESPLQMFDRILRLELERIKRADCEGLASFVDSSECCELPGIREAAAQFARAQIACDFDAAVQAAEAAASEAPPDKAEEAAVISAREYRTEIVDEVHEVIPGDRLVEVVGYVGITRPTG